MLSKKQNFFPIGIDPHEDTSGVCILKPDGTILSLFSIKNCSKLDTDSLIKQVNKFAKKLKPIFIIETTNVFWRPLFSYLKRKGYPVETVNSFQTKSSRGTRMRKTKTDLIDAKHIAELYLQGKSHPTKFPDEPLMSLRELTRLNKSLIEIKASLLNRICGYLFQVFPEFWNLISKTSLALLQI